MRFLPLLIAATAAAQSPAIQLSHTTESLRAASAVSRQIAWASGTHGTYLRTIDAGRTWTSAQVPDAATLDFRGVVAFSADEAFLMSSGPGDQSRIYHTSDAGHHWQLQFTNANPKGFFDSIVFWDRTHGVVLGDPIPDESGKPKFELLLTDDGQTWHSIPPSQLPPAIDGEGAFAASNTCLSILTPPPVILSGDTRTAKPSACRSRRTPCTPLSPAAWKGVLPVHLASLALSKSGSLWEQQSSTPPDPNLWFATGGRAARVFHSSDRGQTWQVFDTPILHGPDSAGIFSIAFRDALHGVIAGGDYKRPNDDGPNLAFTSDGGKTWTLSPIRPQAYFSAAAYDRKSRNRILLIGHDFIFDFRPPANPRRIAAKKKLDIQFNALTPIPEGGALVVGPKGTIALVP